MGIIVKVRACSSICANFGAGKPIVIALKSKMLGKISHSGFQVGQYIKNWKTHWSKTNLFIMVWSITNNHQSGHSLPSMDFVILVRPVPSIFIVYKLVPILFQSWPTP